MKTKFLFAMKHNHTILYQKLSNPDITFIVGLPGMYPL